MRNRFESGNVNTVEVQNIHLFYLFASESKKFKVYLNLGEGDTPQHFWLGVRFSEH